MTVISVEGLTKHYGDHAAVVDVGFHVDPGETVAILGPNGAGKTTTMEICEGFVPRTSGTVRVLGVDPEDGDAAWRAQLGFVMQSTSLDPELTVAETFALYAGLYPDARPVAEVLEAVGLASEADVRVGQLSGGQQRRVDLGVGIIGRPRVLFLDEPTTGLDPAARRQAWEVVEQLTTTGTTVVLTTHYMEEARCLADRVVVIADGRVITDGKPDDLAAMFDSRSEISFRPPRGTSDLPARFADAVRSGPEVRLRTDDVVGALADLVEWARAHGVDLPGLAVGPVDFEDAYLGLTATSPPARTTAPADPRIPQPQDGVAR